MQATNEHTNKQIEGYRYRVKPPLLRQGLYIRQGPGLCKIFTRHSMEVNIGYCFFLCPVTDISATVAPIGVKFARYISVPDRTSPLWGRCPQRIPKSEIVGQKFGYLTAHISKTVSDSLTSSRRRLSKNVSHGGVATQVSSSSLPPPVWQVCVLLTPLRPVYSDTTQLNSTSNCRHVHSVNNCHRSVLNVVTQCGCL